MREATTKPWTRKEMKLLIDQVPKPITPERYPPNPKVSADLSLIRAARQDGRYLDLNDVQKRIIDARFPLDDEIPRSFTSLGEELGSSASSIRRSYEQIIKNLRKQK